MCPSILPQKALLYTEAVACSSNKSPPHREQNETYTLITRQAPTAPSQEESEHEVLPRAARSKTKSPMDTRTVLLLFTCITASRVSPRSPTRVPPTGRPDCSAEGVARVAPTCRPDVSARRVTRCHKAGSPVLSVLLHRLQGIGGEAESMRRVDHCVCFAVPAISRTISSAGVVPSPPCLPDGGIEEGRRHGLGNLA